VAPGLPLEENNRLISGLESAARRSLTRLKDAGLRDDAFIKEDERSTSTGGIYHSLAPDSVL
jgi:hypothetical protein